MGLCGDATNEEFGLPLHFRPPGPLLTFSAVRIGQDRSPTRIRVAIFYAYLMPPWTPPPNGATPSHILISPTLRATSRQFVRGTSSLNATKYPFFYTHCTSILLQAVRHACADTWHSHATTACVVFFMTSLQREMIHRIFFP